MQIHSHLNKVASRVAHQVKQIFTSEPIYVAIEYNLAVIRVVVAKFTFEKKLLLLDFAHLYLDELVGTGMNNWHKELGALLDKLLTEYKNYHTVTIIGYPFSKVKIENVTLGDKLSADEVEFLMQAKSAEQFTNLDCYYDYLAVNEDRDAQKRDFLLVAADGELMRRDLTGFNDQGILKEIHVDVDLYAFARMCLFHAKDNLAERDFYELRVYLHIDMYSLFMVIILGGNVIYQNAAVYPRLTDRESIKCRVLESINKIPILSTAKLGQVIVSGVYGDGKLIDDLENMLALVANSFHFADLQFKDDVVAQRFSQLEEQMVVAIGLLLRDGYGND